MKNRLVLRIFCVGTVKLATVDKEVAWRGQRKEKKRKKRAKNKGNSEKERNTSEKGINNREK